MLVGCLRPAPFRISLLTAADALGEVRDVVWGTEEDRYVIF